MRIRTPTDFGAIIRDSRSKVGLDQKSLADRIGVSREWIVEIEKGKPRAQMGLVLRALNALGVALEARLETTPAKRTQLDRRTALTSTPSSRRRGSQENDARAHRGPRRSHHRHITSNARGRLTFGYDEKWRSAPDAYPLSLSMPLGLTEHPLRTIESFLWNSLCAIEGMAGGTTIMRIPSCSTNEKSACVTWISRLAIGSVISTTLATIGSTYCFSRIRALFSPRPSILRVLPAPEPRLPKMSAAAPGTRSFSKRSWIRITKNTIT